MWHIMSDGFGGFLVFQDDPMGDALGGAMVNLLFMLLAALVAWLCWALGSALMLPLACIVLLLLVLLLFSNVFEDDLGTIAAASVALRC